MIDNKDILAAELGGIAGVTFVEVLPLQPEYADKHENAAITFRCHFKGPNNVDRYVDVNLGEGISETSAKNQNIVDETRTYIDNLIAAS